MKTDFSALPPVIGIFGSRDFPKLEWVDAFVKRLKAGTLVVSGGALGVDQRAAEAVRKRKDLYLKEIVIDSFEWELFDKTEVGSTRNEMAILYLARHGPSHAFYFSCRPMTGGTAMCMRHADDYKVPYTIYYEDD